MKLPIYATGFDIEKNYDTYFGQLKSKEAVNIIS